jgi:hypothetical protein
VQVFSSKTAVICLGLLLRPLVRFCIRHSLRLQELQEVAKRVFVEEAKVLLSDKENGSRITLLTGVHRKDISRFKLDVDTPSEARSLAARVLGTWEAKVRNEGEAYRTLYEDQFRSLVREVSSDVNPSAVSFELTRTGAITQEEAQYTLARPTFITSSDATESYLLAANDINSLLSSVHHNVTRDSDRSHNTHLPRHHLSTEYDRIPAECVPVIEEWLLREGHALHARVRQFISQYDLDTTPGETNDAHTPSPRSNKMVAVRFTSFGAILSEDGNCTETSALKRRNKEDSST